MAESPFFHLWQYFSAHNNDVKAAEPTPSAQLATCSRDETVKMWEPSETGHRQIVEYKNGQHVNSLAFYEAPGGHEYVLAGRKDGTIAVFSSESNEPLCVIRAHTMNVCTLRVDNRTGRAISGGWDSKAVVTDIQKALKGEASQIVALEGHSHSVWAAEFVPGHADCFVTASADQKIKLWRGGQCVNTLEGHTDVVRSVLPLNGSRLISVANDSTIKLWNLESGKLLDSYNSTHGEFIYSLALIKCPTGHKYAVTCSERGHVEVYDLVADDSVLVFKQLIRVPTVSLWTVRAGADGDFVLAGSNGFVYIFSPNPEKTAPEAVQSAYDAEVSSFVAQEIAAREAQNQDEVKIKVSLDDSGKQLDLLYTKGTDPADAAEHFIRENNLPISYLNEIVDYIKSNVPEAKNYSQYKQSKPANVQKPGKADYEFEIRTSENNSFFLSYNVGEDPDMAAQRCCEKNNLPVAFIPQLVSHLNQNVPELKGFQGAAYADPFTGGGRYVPAQSSESGADFGDPFTSGGRYVPPPPSAPTSLAGAGDPYTAGGRYIPGQSSTDLVPNASQPVDKKRPRSEHVPIKLLFLFNEKAGEKAAETLKRSNTEVGQDHQLEEPLLDALLEMLKPDFEYNEIQTLALEKALQWPMEHIMGIVDVFRFALLNEVHNQNFCHGETGNQTLQHLLRLLISDPTFKVKTMVCRALTNAARHEPGQKMLLKHLGEVTEVVSPLVFWVKPVLQLSAVSCAANLAHVLLQHSEEAGLAELGPREDVLRALIKAAERQQLFSHLSQPTLRRLLQTVATLMWGDPTVIRMGKQRGIADIAQRVKDAAADEPTKNIARDIYAMTLEV